MLIIFGVGDMVGSGIYGTIGLAAGQMGNAVWLAFVGSMIAAMFTGLSYASLASRYPRAAGAAFITQRAYHWAFLSYVVGLTVTASGLTSMATNSNVLATTMATFLRPYPLPLIGAVEPWIVVVGFLLLMAAINFWGIRESMWANVVCTTIEVGGLLFVIAVGMKAWGSVDYFQTPAPAGAAAGGLDLWRISSGAVLTFFAFVGFEDMLNVAEEVKKPEKNMPWGIVLALLITAGLYLATSITVVSVVDYRNLANSELGAPLSQVTDAAAPWLPQWIFEVITMFAAANSVLINYVMGSRMLYGMSRQGLLPRFLGKVHQTRRTPYAAILILLVIVFILAFTGRIGELASATSLLLLLVFCLVNIALVILKRRVNEPHGAFEVPTFVPIAGALCCVGLISARVSRSLTQADESAQSLLIAGGLVVFISFLYLFFRPKTTVARKAANVLD